EVDEIFLKLLRLAPEPRVSSLEEHARRAVEVECRKRRGVNRSDVSGVNDAGRADEDFKRRLVERDAVLHKMVRRIDMRADVRAEAQMRDARDVSLFERLRSFDMNRRVAGVDRKVVRDRNCDVVNSHRSPADYRLTRAVLKTARV